MRKKKLTKIQIFIYLFVFVFFSKFKSDHILEATNCELMMPREKQS